MPTYREKFFLENMVQKTQLTTSIGKWNFLLRKSCWSGASIIPLTRLKLQLRRISWKILKRIAHLSGVTVCINLRSAYCTQWYELYLSSSSDRVWTDATNYCFTLLTLHSHFTHTLLTLYSHWHFVYIRIFRYQNERRGKTSCRWLRLLIMQ